MLIPSIIGLVPHAASSLSRRVNANSQHTERLNQGFTKLIKKGEC